MRPVPDIAIDFVKRAEGCKLVAYRDSRGTWTIGWGHTGPEVVEGLTITMSQAVAYLLVDLALAARRLASVVSAARIAALTDHEYAALLSFVFNLGEQPSWGIWKVLNAGQIDAVPAQMMRFDKAHVAGKVVEVPGLMHRRAAEVALWKVPDADAAVAIVEAGPVAPPSSYTRDAVTPPTPGVSKPLAQSKSFVATCATACAAVASPFVGNLQGVGKTINDTIAPYAGQSEIIQHLQGELTLGLAALAVVSVFLVWLKNHEARSQ